MKKWKWIHKWFSLVLGLFIVLWAVSGILLNHRLLIAPIEVNRKFLPPEYTYNNWNLSAVKSAQSLQSDSLLIYGNIGIWLTDTAFGSYAPFMQGLPDGSDNRRTNNILQTPDGKLFAGTQSGLYQWRPVPASWIEVPIASSDQRIMSVNWHDNRLLVMTRSVLFVSDQTNGRNFEFKRIVLPVASNDDGKTGLFRTLWTLHSGELFGITGQLLVDFFALLLVFLVVTGYVYFFFPRWIKKRKRSGRDTGMHIKTSRFSIRWHNKLGYWLGGFLLITTLTGMFLRPPLLIAISNARVGKIPYSMLDCANHWDDKLRTLEFSDELNGWIVGTNEGFYFADSTFTQRLESFAVQPPVSVMGINVFENVGNGNFLVGSFNGLFMWNPARGLVINHITDQRPVAASDAGSPLGEHLVAGMMRFNQRQLIFEYNKGLINAAIEMPEQLKTLNMPLWNVALEVHTARIFEHIVGLAYILIIPLFGLSLMLILVSGLVVWISRIMR
ncbi:MAG: PepSY domain-containing protein [Bacteroidales bacterium]|nr:PepSY domain-containing protein [Bacteroidales bacterium]